MATLPIKSNADYDNNQILNARLQMLSSAPTSLEAKFYYDTTLKKFGVYNGSKWIYLDELTSTTIITALGYTPANQTITINGYSLANNITLTASDVGALASTTTINDLTSTAQQDALNSGITSTLVTQIGTNQTNITTINGKIPSAASSSNQLADKQYVDDSIQTNSASFDGSWATYLAVPTTVAGFTDEGLPTPSNNNYLIVLADETKDGGTWRYKYVDDGTAYNKNKWQAEYEVNESPFSQAQLDAINSGATTTNIGQIGTNTSDISTINGQITSINTTLASKTGKITSTNGALTQSGGVCSWSIANTLGTADVIVSIYRISDGVQVMTEVDVSASTIVVKFNSTSNISADTYKMIAVG